MAEFYMPAMSLILFAGWVFGVRPWWWFLIPLVVPLIIAVFIAAVKGCKDAVDNHRF